MWNFFGQVGSGLLGTIGSIINTKQINDTNTRNVNATNAANREMVEMQNKAAAAESQKAYDRSKASNQVGLMTAAGMSRAGAINALNGGGSYTPAPVNVAQDAAPQDQTTDLSAITNIAQAFAQRSQQKHEENMLNKSNPDLIDYAKQKSKLKGMFDKINENSGLLGYGELPTLDELYHIFDKDEKYALTNPMIREQVTDYIQKSYDSKNNRTDWTQKLLDSFERDEIREIESEIRKAVKDDYIEASTKEMLVRKANAIYDQLIAAGKSEAFEKLDPEMKRHYYETRMLIDWLHTASDVTMESFVNKVKSYIPGL